MSALTLRQKLRGKTGCLNCRHRRKKCDERTPTCTRCALAGHECGWPSSKQLVDRRFASHPKSRHGSVGREALVCLKSESTARVKLALDLEVIISRHFIENYYGFLLLPNCHRVFQDGWISEIQELMATNRGLRYSVFANAASHIHNIDTHQGMQSLALQYYSKSIRELSGVLDQANNPYIATCNGFLTSVIFLYLHGCMSSQGTYRDIPPHLHAAVRVLTLRFFETTTTIIQPFDHLALESVLYQMFLTSTGHWSDQEPLTEFNLKFWLKAENLLKEFVMFPDGPASLSSPVLGVPVALLRLAIQAKQAYQCPGPQSDVNLRSLRSEIEEWELVVLSKQSLDLSAGDDVFSRQETYYAAATHLYMLVVSLLLEQAEKKTNDMPQELQHDRVPEAVPRHTWQLQKALRIVHAFETDDDWTRCYIGNWTVYTMGFFCSDTKDIGLIRNEFDRRWAVTKFMQIRRFRDDLEMVWKQRTPHSFTPGTNEGEMSGYNRCEGQKR